jgi:hypothetical protein
MATVMVEVPDDAVEELKEELESWQRVSEESSTPRP